MSEAKARKLKVGQKVVFLGKGYNTAGTVTDVGVGGLFIKWEDNDSGWIDYRDFARVKVNEESQKGAAFVHFLWFLCVLFALVLILMEQRATTEAIKRQTEMLAEVTDAQDCDRAEIIGASYHHGRGRR